MTGYTAGKLEKRVVRVASAGCRAGEGADLVGHPRGMAHQVDQVDAIDETSSCNVLVLVDSIDRRDLRFRNSSI